MSYQRRWFYRSKDPTSSVKAPKEGQSDKCQSHKAHLTMLK